MLSPQMPLAISLPQLCPAGGRGPARLLLWSPLTKQSRPSGRWLRRDKAKFRNSTAVWRWT